MSIAKLKPLNRAGDTIVEVLIVCAVLGMVLASGYAIAVASLQVVQLSQERSYALKQAEGQLEMLKASYGTIPAGKLNNQLQGFCLYESTIAPASPAAPVITPKSLGGFSPTLVQSNDNYANYPAECMHDPSASGSCTLYCYHYGIKSQGNNSYLVSVRWDGPAGRPQQVQLTYRLYQ